MTIELIVFVASILFGILLYWRESNGNGLYRFVNKILNSKELQMKPEDKTGFVYKQKFLLRFVYIAFLFLIVSIIVQFLTPINPFGSYDGISMFASTIVGTLIGTYVANFILKSGKVIEEKSDTLEDKVSDVLKKGKDYLDDLGKKNEPNTTVVEDAEIASSDDEKDGKSARERLKDKGFLK